MKICTKCKENKPFEAFSKDAQKKDGLRSSCKECKKSYDKSYVEKNKEAKYSKNSAYNATHKKEKAAYDKHRREQQSDIIKRQKRKYYHNGGKEVGNKWKSNNKELVRSYAHNAKAKRRSLMADSILSHKELTEWQKQQEKVCTYCSCECEDSYHIDHVTPLTKGGKHELINLAISCPSCNHSKGNKTLDQWESTKQELIEAKNKKP